MHRRPITTLAVVLVALALVACGGDDDGEAGTTTAPDATTTTVVGGAGGRTTPTSAATTTTTADDEAETIELSVADGEVRGGGRRTVGLGSTVRIVVTSDVRDHVHLHGYDVLVDVDAGGTSTLEFTADIPGVFEVELEEAQLVLLELEVA